ncbi:MAG: hypothetical protein HRT38_20580 [Alteromonadaceae bacterium]|nr:hypothetical protein [Alteromonadaceae bacterium]
MIKNTEIPPGWKLPVEITCRLGSSSGRQRIIAENDHILIVLHKVPKEHESHRESVFFWCDPEGSWNTSAQGNGLRALDEYLEDYSKMEEVLDESYEKAVVAGDFFKLLEKIAPVQRAVKNMCKTLQDARQIVGEDLIDYRDKAEELHRNIELLYIDSKNGLDYAIAKKAEEQSELQRQTLKAGHRLNTIMALFLPITAAASLLGMNITHGLEKAETWVFGAIVGVCSVLGLLMRSWVIKK